MSVGGLIRHRTTKPTKRQREVLHYVRWHTYVQGFPPSIRELAKLLGLTSPSTMVQHIDTLKRKGMLVSSGRTMRTLRLTAAGLSLVEENPGEFGLNVDADASASSLEEDDGGAYG